MAVVLAPRAHEVSFAHTCMSGMHQLPYSFTLTTVHFQVHVVRTIRSQERVARAVCAAAMLLAVLGAVAVIVCSPDGSATLPLKSASSAPATVSMSNVWSQAHPPAPRATTLADTPPTCWMRMPTSCEKPLSETATPMVWFKDPTGAASEAKCNARLADFNGHCERHDAENVWASGALKYSFLS